ncbi:LysR substrate-binding domain-containing protein [Komagataeibacter rhaeticus]
MRHSGLPLTGWALVHLPVYVARDAITSGQLFPLFEKYCMPIGSLWIIWPAARTLSPKVRAFADFILERFAAMPEAFMPFRDGYGKNRVCRDTIGVTILCLVLASIKQKSRNRLA